MGELNIKDEALIGNARRLAEQFGTSVTGAMRAAVDAMLAEQDREKFARPEAQARAIRDIVESASRLFPPGSTSDHPDMYDEHGLPK